MEVQVGEENTLEYNHFFLENILYLTKGFPWYSPTMPTPRLKAWPFHFKMTQISSQTSGVYLLGVLANAI